MRCLLCVLISFILNINYSVSQDTLMNKLNLQFGMTRLDFFTGIRFAKTVHKIEPFVAAEIGVNRTIFQTRFFPRISGGCVYYVVNKKKIKFGPRFSYSYSMLKVHQQSQHIHQWNELYAGTRVEIGSRLRFTNEIAGGWMNERFYNQFSGRKDGVNSLSFYFNFGISYAW